MPSAEIITIGTELLLGEKQDINTPFIAHALRNLGLDLYRAQIIGDNLDRIASAVKESLQRADIIITTGGLGPTVDDPTRAAIANALDQELVYHEELWTRIHERFQGWNRVPTENNRRQAYLPHGAEAINNPVGTAPAFRIEVGEKTIICLPGVPREMEEIVAQTVVPYLRERYSLDQILVTYTLHVTGMGESLVDELIGDLEALSNPTVGLLAEAGQIDIRVAAKGHDQDSAMRSIMPIVEDIQTRLGINIFGVQDVRLEDVISNWIILSGAHFSIIEAGLGGLLTSRLLKMPIHDATQLDTGISADSLVERVRDHPDLDGNCVILGASLYQEEMNFAIHLSVLFNDAYFRKTHAYGGPPSTAPQFAATIAMDYLRRILLSLPQN